MIDIAGFQVEEKIYESVRSVVYRAKQIEGDRPVILKTLKDEYPDPQEILRYRREFETIRHLNVSGIPQPIGLQRVSNRLILITEDIGGQDLKKLLKTHTFTLRQLFKMAVDTICVLGEIHAANLIHGKSSHPILFSIPKPTTFKLLTSILRGPCRVPDR